MPVVLEACDLTRKFDQYLALAPLNLTLNSGEITVLTGPNGAGKSTLLLCLSGLLAPSGGVVRVEGLDLQRNEREAHRRLAFVPDVPRFYSELSVVEHLRFIALAHDAMDGFDARSKALLGEFGLWEARDLFPHNTSRGMRLKLGLLLAFIRPFRALLLDEPTSALDAQSTMVLADHLSRLRSEGAAILLTTHNPELAQDLANRTLVLQNGALESA
ncbi:MAG TPA: ABC transporter ATP-binding protein [Anaerolineaceae bacterium]